VFQIDDRRICYGRACTLLSRETAKAEGQTKTSMSMEQPEGGWVINPNVKSPLGYPVEYEFMGS